MGAKEAGMAKLTTVDILGDDEALVCYVCGTTENVSERFCAFSRDVHGTDVVEVICDTCEQSHRDDI
jgi:hypothetical protein